MRPAMRAMLGVVLVTMSCGQLSAEESKSSWWPFGGKEETTAPPVATTPPVVAQVAPAAEPESTFNWPSLPTFEWPRLIADEEPNTATVTGAVPPVAAPPIATAPPVVAAPGAPAGTVAQLPITPVTEPEAKPRRSPRFGKAAQEPHRNSWAQTTEPKPTGPAPWQVMKSGTVSAWHKTVDVFTPGDSAEVATPSVSSPVVAQQKPEKSWWKFWGDDETEPEGARTVTEWMAQDRLDP